MNIVLEGPDASGKSTLAHSLSLAFNRLTINSGGPEKYPGECNTRILEFLTHEDVIFDRHPAISEPIYCQFRGTRGPDTEMVQRFYDSKPLIIYCVRDSKSTLESLHQVKDSDTKKHLENITRYDGEIVQAYGDWAMQHARLIYRIGDDKVEFIRQVMSVVCRSPGMVEDIAEFHRKFGLEYTGKPRLLPESLQAFRMRFLREELKEYSDAVWSAWDQSQLDLIERDQGELVYHLESALDSLVDLVYVALGTSYLHGFNFNEAWRRVHAANMRKVRAVTASESRRGSTFDVIKPVDWEPPSHKDLVEDHAHRN